MSLTKLILSSAQLAILICGAVVVTSAAGDVDLSFNANLMRDRKALVYRTRIQPDGKILVFGTFNAANGRPTRTLMRLNSDGTTDTSFSPPAISGGSILCVAAIDLQSDGKIIIGGVFDRIDGVQGVRNGIARLNPNGSLDTSFAGDPTVSSIWSDVRDLVVLSNNDILVGGPGGLVKLLPDGQVDPSFSAANRSVSVEWIEVQTDGKILNSNSGNIRRYNADGTTEAGFTVPTFTGTVYDIAVQSDGKLLAGGLFSHVNGFALPRLARFNSNGTVDSTFVTTYDGGIVTKLAPVADGKVVVFGGSNTVQPAATLRRINPDGTVDKTFVAPQSLSGWDLDVQADGRIVVSSDASTTPRVLVTRLLSNGGLDDSFMANLGINGEGYAIRVLPDGKFYAGGLFSFANDANRVGLARFNSDGTTDTSFAAPLTGNPESAIVTAIDVQADGKVIANPGASGVVRFKTDGSFDVAFPETPSASAIKVLANGQIMIGGDQYLKRFNSNGTLDGFATPNGRVLAITQQADGKIVIAGTFSEINSAPRGRIARINTDGSLDATFNTTTGANHDINDIAIQSDGKVIIAGSFTGVNLVGRPYLARLNTDGSLDTSFTPPISGRVFTVELQPDGRVLIGRFIEVANREEGRVVRVNTDGTIDGSFTASTGDRIRDIRMFPDGKILVAGQFPWVNGVARHGLVRLLSNLAPSDTLFDYDGDGKSDVSVFRASENRWYILRSSDGVVSQPVFAIAGDIPVPADYDGDQKTDVAIFRPSNGQWWYISSVDGSFVLNPFGATGDIPRPSDFDGDGKADFVLFRPSDNKWYRFGSTAGNVPPTEFGIAGDKPVIGDFDGDGKSDLAVFRPSTGDWWYAASSAGGAARQTHWGQNGDLPVPADYDGDSKTDFAVFRPSDGGWYVLNSSNGTFTTTAFGTNGDRPVAADYDGDGRADLAVFRPSTGIWYLLRSTSGFAGLNFGISTDTPTPGAFVD